MELDQLRKIITKRLLGEISEEEERELRDWLAESEDNRRLMEELASENFLKRAIVDRNKVSRERCWNKLESLTTGRRTRIIRLRWLGVAAAVLVLGVGMTALWLFRDPSSQHSALPLAAQIVPGSPKAVVELAGGKRLFLTNDTTLQLEEQGIRLVNHKDTLNIFDQQKGNRTAGDFHVITIPRGGEYIARLEDGTLVHLNAASEMKVPSDFGVDGRQVWLRGEAFFSVAHDKDRKFTVHTDKADIVVLGTEFDVRAYAEEKEVVTTLVEGTVRVNSGETVRQLQPGYQARVAETGTIVTEKVNVYPFIAWKTGRMVFEDERLEKIMTELQRWYDFEVHYADPGVKDMRFTIDILKYSDITKVLKLMEKMEKVTFIQRENTVTLNSR